MLQRAFAYAALFLLPFPALNFGVSFTVGDLFLVLALLFNLHEAADLHPFQIPFLLAIPFVLISALIDPDSSVIAAGQTIYIWCVLLPFGWCAFTNLPNRRIAHVLLLAVATNCIIAAAQSARILPPLGSQVVVDVGQEINRGAGLHLNCNGMVMQLTPMFLLLPYVRRTSIRLVNLAAFFLGFVGTVSKASILAIPGFIYYLLREPHKKQFVLLTLAVALVGIIFLARQRSFVEFTHDWQNYVESRMEHSQDSISRRSELVQFAMDYLPECYVTGFGLGGANAIMQQAENNVHVYYVGLVLVVGGPATLLILLGFLLQFRGLRQSGEVYYAWYLAAHLLACMVMTLLAMSFQNLPFMVAGAIWVRRYRANIAESQSPVQTATKS